MTTELTTLDWRGEPSTWPVTPYYEPGAATIDVTTALGFPKKARDAARNPGVALLFSDATGSGLPSPPMVFVQGTAEVDESDLRANADRYARDHVRKLHGSDARPPPRRRGYDWYYLRLYLRVRPERVYVWERGDTTLEPLLFDSHMEEVRSGHDETPDVERLPPRGVPAAWEGRLDELGSRYPTAVITLVGPDGFPFSVRAPVRADKGERIVRIAGEPVGVPLRPGRACLTAHDHDEALGWQRNFQVRGDLVRDAGAWVLVPHRLVEGFELPPRPPLTRIRLNYRKIRGFRRRAKRELSHRAGG